MSVSDADSLRLEMTGGAVARLVIDVKGESVNTLRADFAQRLSELLDQVEEDEAVSALVIASAKPDTFVVGADIDMLVKAESKEVLIRLSRSGQAVLDRLERLQKPSVAAIHGSCLGGGLELALACRERVCSNDPKTKLGLPEVQLGLLPGLGGSQRLPRLIGVQAALDLMLTGRQVDARRAKRIGLVDEVVPASILQHAAQVRATELATEPAKRRTLDALKGLFDKDELAELALTENPIGRRVLFDQAKKRLLEKTHGNYPAPERILDVVKLGLERGARAGQEAESEAFGELANTEQAAALMQIFLSTQALKKDTGVATNVDARPVQRVCVVGAGLMGAGIAHVTAQRAKLPVRLKDKDHAGLRRGLLYIRGLVDESIQRRRSTPFEAARLMSYITVTTDFSGLAGADVVIEAVFEDLSLKRQILADVEQHGHPEAIFCSNTSALPIKAIAEHAQHPERVVGMHYFSPVHRMPLLEVVVTDKTADWVTRTVVELGKSQSKTVIVVRDGPGFYTSRILAPYLNEALYVLGEGVAVEKIDKALVEAGFPVGPLALLDEIGVDVAGKVAKTMHDALGSRFQPPPLTEKLIDDGRYGRKAARGFYQYSEQLAKGRRPVDPFVYGVLGVTPNQQLDAKRIAERCLFAMLNEAVRCLDAGIVRSPRDANIGAIFGLGFPPYLGGPLAYVERRGVGQIVERLEQLERECGERFKPAEALYRLARSGQKLADLEAARPS